MNGFFCALRLDGSPVPHPERARLAAAVATEGNGAAWAEDGPFTAFASTEPAALRPLLARHGPLLGIGDVRLDNRSEVAAWSGVPLEGAADLEVVLAAVRARGAECLDGVMGDFGFAVWDGETRTLRALRDPFGVKGLFAAQRDGTLVLSSRLSALGREGEYDEEFVADFLVGGAAHSERTIWAGVQAVTPGEILTARGGSVSARRFWSATDHPPAATVDEAEAVERWRALFTEAVRVRMEGGVPVWSQLSGGLDSSSVVSMAETLARAGTVPARLAGTASVVETLGDGDERRYAGAVLRRFELPNEELVDFWAWQDDGLPPTRTDEPRSHYPFWARDRRMAGLVREAGGRVLLSGQGSDHYLGGNWSYVTDLLAAGRVGEGLRELTRLSVAARQSFWTGLGRHGVFPFLPAGLKLRFVRPAEQVPAWLDPAFMRRADIPFRLPAVRYLSAPRGGSFFAHEVAAELRSLAGFIERGPYQDGIEMRYPFLDRRLVEFSLRLPPAMRIRPGGGKYVLREAMRGILPEEVRTRRSKGGIDARLLWAFNRESARLGELLRDPEISQRGWVRADTLRTAAEEARCGQVRNLPFLLCALSLETWLAVRSGRWPGTRAGAAPAAA